MCARQVVLAVYLLWTHKNLVTAEVVEKEYALIPTLFHLDNYDNCMLYGNQALYCMVTLQLLPTNPNDTSKIWKTIEEVSSEPNNYRHDLLRHGLCLPELCVNCNFSLKYDEAQIRLKLQDYYNDKYKYMEIRNRVVEIRCENKNSPYSIDLYDMIYGFLVILYASTLMSATCYDSLKAKVSNDDKKNFLEKYVSAVSIRKNWKRLLKVDFYKKDLESLRCIQGVRFYSMIWLIVIHTGLRNVASFVANPQFVEKVHPFVVFLQFLSEQMKNEASKILLDPTFSIQVFFMLSSWMLTYNFFVQMSKKEKVTLLDLVKIVIRRYFRLTPAMAFLVGFYSTWLVHLSRGPLWDLTIGPEYRSCRTKWWTNLLYINNYFNMNKMCFSHGWYLAVDMQFYLLSLLLLWLMWKWQKKIYITLGTILILHFAALFTVIYKSHYKFSIRATPELAFKQRLQERLQFHLMYLSVFCNCSAMVAGLVFGYIFYKYKEKNIFANRKFSVMWWIFTCGIVGGIMFLPLLVTIDPKHSPILNLIYGTLWRSIFIFSTGMIIFSMTQGQGWVIRQVCESSTVYILGRLTFGAYLIHIFIMRFLFGIKRYGNVLSYSTMVFDSIQYITLAFLGALVLTLFIEMPCYELYKNFVETRSRNPKHDKSTSQT